MLVQQVWKEWEWPIERRSCLSLDPLSVPLVWLLLIGSPCTTASMVSLMNLLCLRYDFTLNPLSSKLILDYVDFKISTDAGRENQIMFIRVEGLTDQLKLLVPVNCHSQHWFYYPCRYWHVGSNPYPCVTYFSSLWRLRLSLQLLQSLSLILI
jgi:hypothetical protein